MIKIKINTKLITNNFLIKAVCFVMASLLWFYIAREQTSIKNIILPVSVTLAENFTAVEIRPRELLVTVSGPAKDVADLQEDQVKVNLNLQNYTQPTSIQYSIQRRDISLPSAVSIENIRPPQVKIVVDRLITKDLNVQVKFSGAPVEGYELISYSCNPSLTSIRGPEAILQRLDSISTLPIILTGRNRSFVQSVPLASVLPDDRNSATRVIDVYAYIDEKPERKTFEKIPLKYIHPPDQKKKVTLTPATVNIELQGNPAVIKNVDTSKIQLFVDISKLENGSYRLPVMYWLPADVKAISILPAEVEVQID